MPLMLNFKAKGNQVNFRNYSGLTPVPSALTPSLKKKTTFFIFV